MEDQLEVVIEGTPISQQGRDRKGVWKEKVARAAEAQVLEEQQLNAFLCPEIEVSIVCFYVGEMDGDLDNFAKPILDGLNTKLWSDDKQIARLTLRREPLDGDAWSYKDLSPRLFARLKRASTPAPFVFVQAMQYRRSVRLP